MYEEPMEDDAKARDYLDRLRIEINKIVTLMMEADRDGMQIGFNIQPQPPHNVDIQVTKIWK